MSVSRSYGIIQLIINGNDVNAFNRNSNVNFFAKDAEVTIQNPDENITISVKLSQMDYTTGCLFALASEKYKLSIHFTRDNVTTTLPIDMAWNLISFFKLYRSYDGYDCRAFAYEMTYGRGKVTDDYAGAYPKYLDEKPMRSENQLTCGDVVHLYDNTRLYHHFAVFIGQRNYLSLFGMHGPLIVTTLDEMKKGFSTDCCSLALKKNGLFSASNKILFTTASQTMSGSTIDHFSENRINPRPHVIDDDVENTANETCNIL